MIKMPPRIALAIGLQYFNHSADDADVNYILIEAEREGESVKHSIHLQDCHTALSSSLYISPSLSLPLPLKEHCYSHCST